MDLDGDGFTIIRQVIGPSLCQEFAEQVAGQLRQDHRAAIEGSPSRRSRDLVGGRNLLALWDGWRQITDHPQIRRMVSEVVGSHAGLVRGLYFDKPPGHGWSLAMHRDKTIAVSEHQTPPEPFSKPTSKGGVPHVEASTELLQRMLTLRIHLDPMRDSNGPLMVIPGSHRDLDSTHSSPVTTIHCELGDAFVMRPLLIHGSRASDPTTSLHRRVIHLEVAPESELPGKYDWHQFEPLFPG